MMNMNQNPGTVNATTCKIKNLIINITKDIIIYLLF